MRSIISSESLKKIPKAINENLQFFQSGERDLPAALQVLSFLLEENLQLFLEEKRDVITSQFVSNSISKSIKLLKLSMKHKLQNE